MSQSNEVEETTVEALEVTTAEAPEVTVEAQPTEVELNSLLNDEFKSASNLKDFKDVNQLAKSYIELQRMVGNSVRIPAADASDEAKQDFLNKIKDVDGVLLKNDENLFDKLGRPEAPEKYNLQDALKEDLLKSAPYLEDEVNDFKSIAHKIGLTDSQAKQLVEMRLGAIEGEVKAVEETRIAAEGHLKKLWGQEYNNRLDAARKLIGVYSDKGPEYKDAIEQLVNSPAGNNPVLLQMMSELAETYQEKGHIGIQGATFGTTPETALMKIQEKKADRGFMEAYLDDRHPGHKQSVAEITRLYQIANGSN